MGSGRKNRRKIRDELASEGKLVTRAAVRAIHESRKPLHKPRPTYVVNRLNDPDNAEDDDGDYSYFDPAPDDCGFPALAADGVSEMLLSRCNNKARKQDQEDLHTGLSISNDSTRAMTSTRFLYRRVSPCSKSNARG